MHTWNALYYILCRYVVYATVHIQLVASVSKFNK